MTEEEQLMMALAESQKMAQVEEAKRKQEQESRQD